MKLLYRITSRISLALLILFAVWGTVFYFIMIDEINDETDDALEDYSEYIITRALAGEKLPDKDNGTNNSYHIKEVTEEYALQNPGVQYIDEMVYIYTKKETEPARTLKTIFKDRENRYFELSVSIPTIEKQDLKETILYWIIILYIILLISIIAVNAWVLRRSICPLYVLLNWLGKLTLGKDIPPLDNETDITEFRKLNEAILYSAQRNAEMYEQQSLFIGHASHELQTPVAICQNRLEMLADEPGLTENQLEEILKTRQTLEYIAKLNRTLLLLTKVENRQFPDSSDIDVNALLKKLSSDFGEAYEHKEIGIYLKEKSDLHLHMNESLAFVLFSNILKNACIHSPQGGNVNILITSYNIVFSNTATEGALNPDYIFRRFYQGQRKENSAGLGLSLVKSICHLYNMDIKYSFEDEMHHFNLKINS